MRTENIYKPAYTTTAIRVQKQLTSYSWKKSERGPEPICLVLPLALRQFWIVPSRRPPHRLELNNSNGELIHQYGTPWYISNWIYIPNTDVSKKAAGHLVIKTSWIQVKFKVFFQRDSSWHLTILKFNGRPFSLLISDIKIAKAWSDR